METTRIALAPDIQQARIATLQQLIKRTMAEIKRADAAGNYTGAACLASDLAHYYTQLSAATRSESIDTSAQRRNSTARGW